VNTANITKFAIVTAILLLLISGGLFLLLNFRKLIPAETAVESNKTLLDTTGTGKQEVPLGLSEDKNWPAEKAGIKRFQIGGTLTKNPYTTNEDLVVFEIEIPLGGDKKVVKIYSAALDGPSGYPAVSLMRVSKIGASNPASESIMLGLNELVGNNNFREEKTIVVQFLFRESKEELSRYYDGLLGEGGGCRSECTALVEQIKMNIEKSVATFNYLSDLEKEESLGLYVFVTNLYVEYQ